MQQPHSGIKQMEELGDRARDVIAAGRSAFEGQQLGKMLDVAAGLRKDHEAKLVEAGLGQRSDRLCPPRLGLVQPVVDRGSDGPERRAVGVCEVVSPGNPDRSVLAVGRRPDRELTGAPGQLVHGGVTDIGPASFQLWRETSEMTVTAVPEARHAHGAPGLVPEHQREGYDVRKRFNRATERKLHDREAWMRHQVLPTRPGHAVSAHQGDGRP